MQYLLLYAKSPKQEKLNLKKMENQNIIFLTSRVHPGESLASWKLKGFMEYLTGNTKEANYLKNNFIFVVIPFLNPDGVSIGNYRCS